MSRRDDSAEPDAGGPRFASRRIASAMVLRLAKLFLKSGLSFGDFQEISRSAFCSAAEEHVSKSGGRPTTSRIAVLTGLSRADVAKTRKINGLPESRAHYRPRTDRVMHGWRSDADFTNASGFPAPLVRRGARSFEELCRRYSGDIPTKALLEELLARHLVREVSPELYEPISEDPDSHAVLSLEPDEITASADVFFDTYVDAPSTSKATRIATVFPTKRVPAHVVRTCRQRVSKFVSALSSYVHAESIASTAKPDSASATLNFVILESESLAASQQNKPKS